MTPRPVRTKPLKPSLKAARANARGYAARRALKKTSGDALDVYEYSASRMRRSGVRLTLDRDEEAGISKASGAEGDSTLDDIREKIRLRIASADEDGVVESDEDEEIDSDAAFEDESDEERFANFKFGDSKGKGLKAKGRAKERGMPQGDERPKVSFAVDVDLNEDEDGGSTPKPVDPSSEDGDSDDSGEEAESDEGAGENDNDEPSSMIELSKMLDEPRPGLDSDSDSEIGSEEEPETPSRASDDLDGASKLASFISGLDTSSKKRKLEGGSLGRSGKKRVVVQDQTEAGPEGEFGAKSGSQPLTLSDLLTPTTSLSQSTKALQNTTKSALAAPLPQRTQDRLDREAAYAATKEEVQKWAPTMKRIREAEHLAFPLQGPSSGRGVGVSNADVIARFQPSTPMESAVSALLRAASLHTDAAAAEAESTLATAIISGEDLTARRAQLRKSRELMFRADLKAKRVAKIKSKAYRRMKKREREKEQKMTVELGLEDDNGDNDEERLKAEALRAKERATLRHQTTGKWARAMRNKGEMGEADVEAVKVLQDRSELLRRKISGADESSESDSDGEERDIEELERLGKADLLEDASGKATGIMGMKFMRDAVARAEREAAAMADEARLGILGQELESGVGNPMGDQTVGGNEGRRIYKPGQVQPPPTYSDISSTLKSSSPADTHNSPPLASPPLNPASIFNPIATNPNSNLESNDALNPWLAAANSATSATAGKIARKSNIAQTTKLQKVQARSEEEQTRAREDAIVEIDMDQAMVLSESQETADKKKSTQVGEKGGSGHVGAVSVDAAYAPSEDEGSDADERTPTAFKQRELVAMAFAGDNVVENFILEKQRVIEEDAPKEIDATLPGWGSWGGHGTKKQMPRPNLIRKVAGVEASQRADAGKQNIIISEKKDKKAARYLIKDLPHPYTSREQFSRSIATPIGTEWNTRAMHQRATLPRVVKKMGTIIEPLEKLL